MRALGTYIVVTRRHIPQDIVSKGGIILAGKNHDEDYFEAVVNSVGSDFEEFNLHKGDYVLVENTTNKFKIGSNKAGEVYAVSGYDVICVIEEDDDELD